MLAVGLQERHDVCHVLNQSALKRWTRLLHLRKTKMTSVTFVGVHPSVRLHALSCHVDMSTTQIV